MAIQLEFSITTEDSAEALRAALARYNPGRKLRIWRGITGWLVCIVLGVVLVHLIQSPASPTPGTAGTSAWYQSVNLTGIEWTRLLAIFGIAAFAIVATLLQIWMRRRAQAKRLFAEERYMVTADNDRLCWGTQTARTEYQWHGLHGFDETPNLFVIYTTDLKEARKRKLIQFLVIPKRSLASPATRAEFEQLLATHVREQFSAFPVIPLASAATPEARRDATS